jgi:hypothetical protein
MTVTRGAPTDGAAWTIDNCSQRVIRGGAWLSSSDKLRSSFRDRLIPGYRVNQVGFRVGRTLTHLEDWIPAERVRLIFAIEQGVRRNLWHLSFPHRFLKRMSGYSRFVHNVRISRVMWSHILDFVLMTSLLNLAILGLPVAQRLVRRTLKISFDIQNERSAPHPAAKSFKKTNRRKSCGPSTLILLSCIFKHFAKVGKSGPS